MKKMMFIVAAFALTLTIACGDAAKTTDNKDSVKTTVVADTLKKVVADSTANKGPEYTSAYICPMHCAGSGSDKAGKCPKCGMDYIENPVKKQ